MTNHERAEHPRELARPHAAPPPDAPRTKAGQALIDAIDGLRFVSTEELIGEILAIEAEAAAAALRDYRNHYNAAERRESVREIAAHHGIRTGNNEREVEWLTRPSIDVRHRDPG